jgi:hypothetical protein
MQILSALIVRSLAFLGQVEGPEASTETRPPDLWLLAWLPCFCSDYVSACKNNSGTSNYSTSQACLVVTDNRRPETLSLPHGLATPIKPTTHSSQAASLWTREWQPCGLVPNKSFFSKHGVVFIRQYVTSGAKTRERLTGQASPGLLPWPLCPALSQTQTSELTPRASGLWILDLTALLAFPSSISLSLPLLSTWPTPQTR